MSYKIGITGGIGAGKTLVASIFAILNVPVYNADERAKALMIGDEPTKESIINLLGPGSYLSNGQLNSKYIAEKVFPDPWLLNHLNAIVHPAVARDYHAWHSNQSSAVYTLKEAALLFDAGSFLTMDAIIVVSASEEIRIQRVMRRDQSSRESVQSRIERQWPEERRLQMADFVIKNEETLPLIPQILTVHRSLK
ncbi:MAG: dephospho-CoA kinase [Saprospiraceae bacterium]|nr:dephospho-CoA kinase [Saprospiraceae bacterium]